MTEQKSFKTFQTAAMAVDPIHVGTGGARLGRVDLTIVRDPVTRVPKIPGSSLAGVLRSYVAMEKGKMGCAGQGQGGDGHCGGADCPVCTVFGFASNKGGGFAGLAAFSDAHLLFFPVATGKGPLWLTAPAALRQVKGLHVEDVEEDKIFVGGGQNGKLAVGWLHLPAEKWGDQPEDFDDTLQSLSIPGHIRGKSALVSDKLFTHIVNSNLETRTSVSIDPATGAAQDGALFTYEALPRGSVLLWDITCRNPAHFKIGGADVKAVENLGAVHGVAKTGFPYLEALGIGGMASRGLGRLRVLNDKSGGGAK